MSLTSNKKEEVCDAFWQDVDEKFFQGIPTPLLDAIARESDAQLCYFDGLGSSTETRKSFSESDSEDVVEARGFVTLERGKLDSVLFPSPWEEIASCELVHRLLVKDTELQHIQQLFFNCHGEPFGSRNAEHADAIVSTLLGLPFIEHLDQGSRDVLNSAMCLDTSRILHDTSADYKNSSLPSCILNDALQMFSSRLCDTKFLVDKRSDLGETFGRIKALRLMFTFPDFGFHLKNYTPEFIEDMLNIKDWKSFYQKILFWHMENLRRCKGRRVDRLMTMSKDLKNGDQNSHFLGLGNVILGPHPIRFHNYGNPWDFSLLEQERSMWLSCVLPRWLRCQDFTYDSRNLSSAPSSNSLHLTSLKYLDLERERIFLSHQLKATLHRKAYLFRQVEQAIKRYRPPCYDFWNCIEESMMNLYRYEVYNSLTPGHYAYNLSRQAYDLSFLRMLSVLKGTNIPSWWTEEGLCSVCGSGITYDEDPVVFCDGCFSPAHHGCVGYPFVSVSHRDIPVQELLEHLTFGGQHQVTSSTFQSALANKQTEGYREVSTIQGLSCNGNNSTANEDWFCDACHIVLHQVQDMRIALLIIRHLAGPRTPQEFNQILHHERWRELPPSFIYYLPVLLSAKNEPFYFFKNSDRISDDNFCSLCRSSTSLVESRCKRPICANSAVAYAVPETSSNDATVGQRRRTEFVQHNNSEEPRTGLTEVHVSDPQCAHAVESFVDDYFCLLHANTFSYWSRWVVTVGVDRSLVSFDGANEMNQENAPHHAIDRSAVEPHRTSSRMKQCWCVAGSACCDKRYEHYIVSLPHCSLCGYDPYFKGGGALKRAKSQKKNSEFCHIRCVIAVNGILKQEFAQYDIQRCLSNQRCSFCQEIGPGVVSCNIPGCSILYHMPCVTQLRECFTDFVDMRPIFCCRKHSKKNLPIQSLRRYQCSMEKKKKRNQNKHSTGFNPIVERKTSFHLTHVSYSVYDFLFRGKIKQLQVDLEPFSKEFIQKVFGVPSTRLSHFNDLTWMLSSLNWGEIQKSRVFYRPEYLECVRLSYLHGYLDAVLKLYTYMMDDFPDEYAYKFLFETLISLADQKSLYVSPEIWSPVARIELVCCLCCVEKDLFQEDQALLFRCDRCGCCICSRCLLTNDPEAMKAKGVQEDASCEDSLNVSRVHPQNVTQNALVLTQSSVKGTPVEQFRCTRCQEAQSIESISCALCCRWDGYMIKHVNNLRSNVWVHILCRNWFLRETSTYRSTKSHQHEWIAEVPQLGGGCVFCSLPFGFLWVCDDADCSNIFHISCCYLWNCTLKVRKNSDATHRFAYCFQHLKCRPDQASLYASLTKVHRSWGILRSHSVSHEEYKNGSLRLIEGFIKGIRVQMSEELRECEAPLFFSFTQHIAKKASQRLGEKDRGFELTSSLFETKGDKRLCALQHLLAKIVCSGQIVLFRRLLGLIKENPMIPRKNDAVSDQESAILCDTQFLNAIEESRKELNYQNRARVMKLCSNSFSIQILHKLLDEKGPVVSQFLVLPRTTKRLRPIEMVAEVQPRRRGRPRKSAIEKDQKLNHVESTSMCVKVAQDSAQNSVTKIQENRSEQLSERTSSGRRRPLMSHTAQTYQGLKIHAKSMYRSIPNYLSPLSLYLPTPHSFGVPNQQNTEGFPLLHTPYPYCRNPLTVPLPYYNQEFPISPPKYSGGQYNNPSLIISPPECRPSISSRVQPSNQGAMFHYFNVPNPFYVLSPPLMFQSRQPHPQEHPNQYRPPHYFSPPFR